jgi:hypothetical protein
MRTNNMPAGLRGRAIKEINMSDLIDRQAAIDAADDMVEPQESEDKE